MKFSRHFSLLRISALAAALFALTTTAAAESIFVSPERVRGMLILAAPPQAASGAAANELAELHLIEGMRTREQMARAIADDRDESIFIFREVIGAGFTAQALPLTAVLSAHVGDDESANTDALKKSFARMRPYNADKSLHPICKTKTRNDSYPSGHATAGYLQALTLIELFPEKRDEILARADEYANNRMVCGVHYRSDIQAARLLAYAVHAIMLENPQFKTEMSAARTEARGLLCADHCKK